MSYLKIDFPASNSESISQKYRSGVHLETNISVKAIDANKK